MCAPVSRSAAARPRGGPRPRGRLRTLAASRAPRPGFAAPAGVPGRCPAARCGVPPLAARLPARGVPRRARALLTRPRCAALTPPSNGDAWIAARDLPSSHSARAVKLEHASRRAVERVAGDERAGARGGPRVRPTQPRPGVAAPRGEVSLAEAKLRPRDRTLALTWWPPEPSMLEASTSSSSTNHEVSPTARRTAGAPSPNCGRGAPTWPWVIRRWRTPRTRPRAADARGAGHAQRPAEHDNGQAMQAAEIRHWRASS